MLRPGAARADGPGLLHPAGPGVRQLLHQRSRVPGPAADVRRPVRPPAADQRVERGRPALALQLVLPAAAARRGPAESPGARDAQLQVCRGQVRGRREKVRGAGARSGQSPGPVDDQQLVRAAREPRVSGAHLQVVDQPTPEPGLVPAGGQPAPLAPAVTERVPAADIPLDEEGPCGTK